MPRKGDKRKRRSDDESSSGASTSKNAKNTKKEETPAIEEVTTIPAVFTKSGKVLAFGQGDVGQLGLGDEVLERKRPALVKEVDDIKFIQSVCGGMHTVILTEDGEVYTFGCNDEGALGRATSGTDDEEYYARKVALPDGVKIIQVSAGDSHTAALSDKGEVYAWGAYRDASGQMGLTAASLGKKNEIRKIYPKGDEIEDPAIKVASGNDHTVILTKDGSIYTNGTGEQGQLGRLD
uniref:RCC1-like domain-containing protein n=1 Tax=Clytia hemisphaerica TaxID=252671 RepID=A0A7M5XE24_9CNID